MARPTLNDVAALAGVSKSLVSLVMREEPGVNERTRNKVFAAAAELGYQPDSRARLLRSGHSRLLGVVFGLGHTFHADLVTALYTVSRDVGYELALSAFTHERSEAEAIGGLQRDRCEAIILLGPVSTADKMARLAEQLPVVVLARDVRAPEVDTVRTDDVRGMEQAVDHLVGLGHERIAHIDGGRAPGATQRRSGYRGAMRRHGLDRYVRIVPGGLTEEDGFAAAAALLSEAPTAVTVFNDRCATGVLHTFAQAGLTVPDDVSVVGYDDSSLARLAHIDLTTVAQDTVAMAELAVAHAIGRIAGEPIRPRNVVVPPHLVVRGTTAPVRSAGGAGGRTKGGATKSGGVTK